MKNRDNNGKFIKGNELSKGRQAGSKNKLTLDLQKAIKEVETEKKVNLFKHFVMRGYKNDKVLVALIKKLVPDKLQTEGLLEGDLTIKIVSAVPRPENDKDSQS